MVVDLLDAGGVLGGHDRGPTSLIGGDEAVQMHDAVADIHLGSHIC